MLTARIPEWMRGRALFKHRGTIVMLVSLLYISMLLYAWILPTTTPRLSLSLTFPTPDTPQIDWLLVGDDLWEQGVRPGDRVLALDHQPPRPEQARRWRGSHVSIQISTGQLVELDVQTLYGDTQLWPMLLISPWFMLLGTLVFLRAPDPLVGRTSYALLTCSAFALASAPSAYSNMVLGSIVSRFAVSLFPAYFAQFCLVFPKPRGSPRLRALLPASMLLITIVSLLVMIWWPNFYVETTFVRMSLFSAYLLLGVSALMVSLFTYKEGPVGGIVIVCAGALLATLPFLMFVTIPISLNRAPLLAPEYAILPLVVLPASFAFAILRYRVLEMSLLQRWLVHGLPWVVLLILYALVLVVQLPLLVGLTPSIYTLVLAAEFVVLGAVGSGWLVPRLRLALDRLIFKDAYDYRTVLRTLSNDLASVADFSPLAALLPETLCQLMNLRFVLLLTDAEDGPREMGNSGLPPTELLPILRATLHTVQEHPQEMHILDQTMLLVPLRIYNMVVGYLCLGPKTNGEPFRREDHDLLATLSGQLGAIVRTTQLIVELRAQVSELDTLNTQLQTAQEAERTRIAADLHDESLQTALHLQRQLSHHVPPDPNAEIARVLSETLVEQLRRACTGLRPAVLEDLGLAAALDGLALECTRRHNIPIILTIDPDIADQDLNTSSELVLYRVVQEATTNAIRHAQPQSIHISLRQATQNIQVSVTDDGIGFVVPKNFNQFVAEGHLGLAGLHERVQRAHGQIQIFSTHNVGTIIQVELPLEESVL